MSCFVGQENPSQTQSNAPASASSLLQIVILITSLPTEPKGSDFSIVPRPSDETTQSKTLLNYSVTSNIFKGLFFLFLTVCIYVCPSVGSCTQAQMLLQSKEIPGSWPAMNHLDICSLQEQSRSLTAETSLQPNY